jgi:hypothetical protein
MKIEMIESIICSVYQLNSFIAPPYVQTGSPAHCDRKKQVFTVTNKFILTKRSYHACT